MQKGFNPQQMMKQLQQLQARMAEAQRVIDETVVEGSAGGGAVKVTMTAKPQLESIAIQPDVLDAEDVEMLQDLITAAVNEALEKVREVQSSQMSGLTGGINIPGLTP
ncbi:MAG TPA: YbaB/EbfC family nucleoid-associated protein [Dehalococcoidia bacterium]|nr:YbaB/EbfC family nucleoid-associated protein [Dehalococcoidia bacterium]